MHKLGALLCRSLIAYKPFYFDEKMASEFVNDKFGKELPSNNLPWFISNVLANYKVALCKYRTNLSSYSL